MSGARGGIYYWKCDRPAALHGVRRSGEPPDDWLREPLRELLAGTFRGPLGLRPFASQGNHRTYLLEHGEGVAFVRVEDGPEGDGHLAMESRVLGAVAATGVPAPRVLFTDASRKRAPFAVQVIEYFDCPDLNTLHREGRLPLVRTAKEIGRAVARWQAVPVSGFGPFDPEVAQWSGRLRGYHDSYATYFHLHLDRHLLVLEQCGLLSRSETTEVRRVLAAHGGLLEIGESVLVHKDLALWNILGTPEGIRAFVDWDDAIAGDPMDDLSLPACFHSGDVVRAVVEGYAEIRPLPERFDARFRLHLLRNMIVKAVIRSGAGYFDQAEESAFLMATGQDGAALRAFTRERLLSACRGLAAGRPYSEL